MSPEDPDNLWASCRPEGYCLRSLGKIATRIADGQPPGEAISTYAAVAQLARQQGRGPFLIHQLHAAAIEDMATSAIARRLQDFDADSLSRIEAHWTGLTPRLDLRLSLQSERGAFVFYVENVLRPALRELLGPGAQAGTSAEDEPRATFTRNLRLSGLVDLGGGEYQIGFEDLAAGSSFAVSTKKAAEGIHLVRIDFASHEAVIRRGAREAVVQLQARTFTERPFKAVRDPLGFFNTSWNLATPEGREARNAFLDLVRRHPGGIEGYLAETTARYDLLAEEQIAAAQQAIPAKAPSVAEGKDPLPGLLTPMLDVTLRALNGFRLRNEMLQAAIHHRLGQLGTASAPAPPADPWGIDAAPFVHEPTPDGGFTLRSRYEVKPGAPLSYKFAAPDAGLVRGR